VVICGPPKARLVDLVVEPLTMTTSDTLILNVKYYMDKQILPALDRLLGTMGVDVRAWTASIGSQMVASSWAMSARKLMPNSIENYLMKSRQCALCHSVTESGNDLCSTCKNDEQMARFSLANLARKAEVYFLDVFSLSVACLL